MEPAGFPQSEGRNKKAPRPVWGNMPGLTYPEPAKTTEESPSPEPVNPEIAQLVRHPHHHGLHLRRPLPLWVRIIVLMVGWVVVLVGVVGLPLPGPGTLIIAFGAAILSVASELTHRWLRWLLHQRFPWAWRRIDAFRDKIHDKLHRMVHGE